MPVLASGGGGILFLIYLAVWIVNIVGYWIVFRKADQPGWAAIIPIYSTIVLLRVVGRPWWWLLLLWLPPLYVIVYLDLAKSFRRSLWFGIWMAMFLSIILVPVIAFGASRYHGAAGEEPWPTETDGDMGMVTA
jgi:hypothetical protein